MPQSIPPSGWCRTRGTPKVYASSEHGRRHFCADCGTGVFYTNPQVLPGIIDIQSATYDDPDAVPARTHIQIADRIGWMERAHELPAFRLRYASAGQESHKPLRTFCSRLKQTPKARQLENASRDKGPDPAGSDPGFDPGLTPP